MPRIYAFPPDTTKGELLPAGVRFYTYTGQELQSLSRVAFDKDGTRGLATVTMILRTADRKMILDTATGGPAMVTFQTWVEMLPKDIKPTIREEGDLVKNPEYRGPGDERFVLWSEFQKNAGALKEQAEKLVGTT
jgi:hypothetical protein